MADILESGALRQIAGKRYSHQETMTKKTYQELAAGGISTTANQSSSTTATDLDILTSLLASGRITRKDYAVYRKL